MNLNTLVELRNQLEKTLNVEAINQLIEENCSRLEYLQVQEDAELSGAIKTLTEKHREKKDLLDNDARLLTDIVQLTQNKIDLAAEEFLVDNYQLRLSVKSPQDILEFRNIVDDEEFELSLMQRINLQSNWQYPALEIGCRNGRWTKYLVASDPLYIADYYHEFLTASVQQFEPLYQGRIRKYIVEDYCKIPNLPKNQFGLIFSYNFFNYLSIENVKQLLIQSKEWLRPGGRIIFTYNNADLPSAASYAENYFMTYVPKRLLVSIAESLEFEISYSYDSGPAFSLIELKKPGELKSIKVSQVSGEIKFIPDNN
jgi:SAM-dependent methyltransferase